jgi:hypothetical protein
MEICSGSWFSRRCIFARWLIGVRSGCATGTVVIRRWVGIRGFVGAGVGFGVSAVPSLLLKNYQGKHVTIGPKDNLNIFMFMKKGDSKKEKEEQIPVALLIEELSA